MLIPILTQFHNTAREKPNLILSVFKYKWQINMADYLKSNEECIPCWLLQSKIRKVRSEILHTTEI